MNTLCDLIVFFQHNEWIFDVLTIIILIISVLFVLKQLHVQNKILKVELLKDRITLGWSIDEPITEESIDSIKYLPNTLIPEKYKKTKTLIGKYLYLSQVYEYFLYVYTSTQITNNDPLGSLWWKEWMQKLMKDDTFNEIRKLNAASFKEFDNFLKKFENSHDNLSTNNI